MNISNELPPVYQKCVEQFGVDFNDGICFTYGDTCYSKYPLPADLLVHEQVHSNRQKEIGVDEWWRRYLANDQFRLDEELLAYKAQYRFFSDNNKDRNIRSRFLRRIALDLSGSMYGNLVSFSEAQRLISKNA